MAKKKTFHLSNPHVGENPVQQLNTNSWTSRSLPIITATWQNEVDGHDIRLYISEGQVKILSAKVNTSNET